MLTDCRLWKWATTGSGYGTMKIAGRLMYAHRYFFEQQHGPIPESHVIDHLCERPTCCEPSHLRAVPQQENVATYYHNHRETV